jgi:glycosyltransferase involved in cell wall biosynthesis
MVERYSSDTLEVVFHGRVSDAALAERYQSADLVFVPAGRRNLSMEGFGLTVLEALNRGVIPIALDLDGPGEIARLIGCPTVSAEVKEIATFLNSVDLDKLYASFPAFAKNLEKFSVRGQVDALFGASG